MAACFDGVHPHDFKVAAGILQVEDLMGVSVYTVKAGPKYEYKLWVSQGK